MKNFDVVIIGAGPAGCQCARLLVYSGYKVLLVEQHFNFEENNFSSAATPYETFSRFDLPTEVVASFWQNIVIVSSKVKRCWESQEVLGGVFDFAKLRAWIANEVKNNGGDIWMGFRYLRYSQENGKTLVFLKERGKDIITISTKILVDATGFSRSVIYPKKCDRPNFLKGTGIEYLIELPSEIYQKYANTLTFFLGYKWMPKGYSWIFPMDNNMLKVGAAEINEKHQFIEEIKPLKFYINLLLKDYMAIKDYKLIDTHGSILEYSMGLQDIYYRDNVIAIGDAVSTVNFLGGEGIRHAMEGAEISVRYIQDFLQGKSSSFYSYQVAMQRRFASKWNFSEKVSKKVYLEYSDSQIDRGVRLLQNTNFNDLIDILFYYKFDKFSKGIGKYLLAKIKYWWNKFKLIIKT